MTAVHVDEEFVAFVRARQQQLVRAARLYCGDHLAAEDLVQDEPCGAEIAEATVHRADRAGRAGR